VIRLAVRVRREQAELVLADLLELAPAGVEESLLAGDTVEYAVYGAPGELPSLPDLKAAAGDALVEISTSEIADDWQERWKRFHRPLLLEPPQQRSAGAQRVPALYIRPPWEAVSAPREGPIEDIVIDPGQAFGTGAHASTRLCLRLLLKLALEPRRGAVVDVGTGSAVLAIAAARLGFTPVLGLDHERESIAAAQENAAINGAEIELRRFDLRTEALPWLSAEETGVVPTIVLANLLRPLLLELARTMPRAPAHLIAGGLLTEQVEEVSSAFSGRLGMSERERLQSGEWAALWLSAP
jgi:ribosomal protein L11 methyltransferase